MELKIPRNDLARGLRLAAGVAAKKPTMPIMADVLLRAGKALTIAATDLNVSLSAEMACVVTKPGSIALNADDLRRFVASASGDEVTIRADGAWADVRCGKAKYRIAGHADRDFPKIPEAPKDAAEVDAEQLHAMLSAASYAVSQDESRGAMCGVIVDVNGETYTLVSTDGHRIVKVSRKISMPRPTGGRVSIGARGATEIAKLVDGAKACRITFGPGRVWVTVDGITISAGLLDFEIPPFERVFPKTHKSTVTISRDRMIEAIKRVSPLANEFRALVLKSTSTGTLSLATKDADGQELVDEVECEIKGDVAIGVNAKFALDALAHIVGDQITMRTIGELDPIVFVDHDDAGYTGVVMPMRMD